MHPVRASNFSAPKLVLTRFTDYYAVFGIQDSDRQGLILLFCIEFFVFTSTFAHMLIAALPDAETAGKIATLMFSLILVFNGVFQPPTALPGFWSTLPSLYISSTKLPTHTDEYSFHVPCLPPYLSRRRHRRYRPS
jgi:hypothetical protein